MKSQTVLAVGVALAGILIPNSVTSAQTTIPPEQRQGIGGADIPKRPEKLSYPPLTYEPPDPKDSRVHLKSGPIAYVLPDNELPLVDVAVYVRTGDYLEPVGKEGLAGLTGYLLVRGGTKTWGAEELEEKLAFLAARLDSGVSDTQGRVSLNLLTKDLDQGLQILREVLTVPRFEQEKLVLRKQQLLQAMKQRNDDSADIESRERQFLAFGTNFWANRYDTARSLDAIAREDLVKFHREWFCPSNLVVAAAGDFDRDIMIRKLEMLFSDWPYAGTRPPPIPTNTVFANPGIYVVDKDVNQGRLSMMLPGIKRDDRDYFPVAIMNDILGGGGFTSRIVNRVRSDEGLAYDAYSSFPGGVYYPLTFSAGCQTKSRTVAFAASILLEEIRRVASEQVREEELNTSVRGFIDRFPRAFASKAQTANQFAQDEFTGRFQEDPDYWKKYRQRLQSVSREDILRVAGKYLDPARLVVLVVGKKQEILLGHPDHPVKLSEIANGPMVGVPLRDPLTMEPIRQ